MLHRSIGYPLLFDETRGIQCVTTVMRRASALDRSFATPASSLDRKEERGRRFIHGRFLIESAVTSRAPAGRALTETANQDPACLVTSKLFFYKI